MSSSFFPVNDTLISHRLPTLPHVLVALLQGLEKEDLASYANQIIKIDPALTAGLLSLASNQHKPSASAHRSICQVQEQIDITTLQAFISTTGVQQFFSKNLKKRASDNQGEISHLFFLKQFWQQSLTCGLLAKALATLTGYAFPDEAYMTGLLHNIGELVLAKNFPEDWLELLLNTHSADDKKELESDLFLNTHTDLGAQLVQKWGLSDYAVDAIRYHHASSDALLDAHHLSKIIHLSSLLSDADLSHETDLTSRKGTLHRTAFTVANDFFNISAELTGQILYQIHQQVADTANLYAIDIQSTVMSDIDELQLRTYSSQAKNSALLQISRQQLKSAQNPVELRSKIVDMVELLFSYANTQVLILDKTEQSLKLTPDSLVMSSLNKNGMVTMASSGQVIELSIPLGSSKSVVARSALDRTIVSSLDPFDQKQSLTVVDKQLIRLTRSKDFICVPMVWQHELLGVLVMGTQECHSQCSKQNTLLSTFARQAAEACALIVSEAQTPSDQIAISSMHRQAVEIAHEANNPLTIIRNYTEVLAQRFPQDSETQQELEIVKEELERASDIITRLRDLAPEVPSSNDAVDINLEIKQLIKLFQGSLFNSKQVHQPTINCELQLDDRLHPILANRNALRQIVTNLVKNSVEAFRANSITASSQTTESQTASTIHINTHYSVNVNGRSFVEVIISDNGQGIAPEQLNQLFEPLSTEKGEGHSGIGLNITRNLVNDLGGSITCRRLKKGVEFQILLPFKQVDAQK